MQFIFTVGEYMFNDVIYIFTDVEYMFNVGVFEIVCLARWACIRRCHVSCPGLMTAVAWHVGV